MIWFILAIFCFVAVGAVVFDMARFAKKKAKAENPTAGLTDAGGVIYVQGGKTYYRLPKGEIRKIADYAFDLRPGSPDMIMFLDVLDMAKKEHATEVAAMKAEAVKNVKELGKDV